VASPQLEDGRTEIANDIAEHFAQINLSAYEWRVLWAILRKTYGWHKKTDFISYTQLEEITNINRRHIARAISKLLKRNIITKTGTGYSLEYGLQKDYELWLNVTSIGNDTITPIGNKSLPKEVTNKEGAIITYLGMQSLPIQGEPLPKEATKSLPKEVNTKAIKHITKAILQKQGDDFVLPEWIKRETWDAFLEMRKRIKQPMTDYAVRLVIGALERFKSAGDDPNAILDQSIMNNWKGVFALKNNNGGNGHGNYKGNPSQRPAGAFSGLD
jgi:phage replication O-like protein O